MRAVLLLGLALLASCASRPPAPAEPPFEILRHREQRKLEDGVGELAIENRYGEIQVRQTSAAALAVAAVEQRIGQRPRAARLEFFVEGRRQGLRVRYDGRDPARPADPRQGRVDLVVFLPPGLPLALETDFGDIVVRRLDNPVRARSMSGRITIAARGAIEAGSARGEIRVFPMEVPEGARYRIETEGDALLDLPLYAPLALSILASEALHAPPEIGFDRRERNAEGERAALRLGAGTVPFAVRARRVTLLPAWTPIPR